jgi:hypothetical protein
LRAAVPERPILLRDLDEAHEHVFRPDAGLLAEQRRDAPEQRLLLLQAVATLAAPCGVRAMAAQVLDAACSPWTEIFVGGGVAAVAAAFRNAVRG